MADDIGATVALDDEPMPAAVSASWGRLISVNEAQFPSVELDAETYTFGRNSVCNVSYEINHVSGVHCKITREADDKVYIEDSSANGTFLDGEKIGRGKRRLLETGATVSILKKPKGSSTVPEICYTYVELRQAPGDDDTDVNGVDFIARHYILGKQLGTGNFAEVKLGIHRDTNEKYAVKCINKRKFAMQQPRADALQDEVDILKVVDHPNVIGIKETFETDDTLYIVLEYVTGGELFDYIVNKTRLSEDETRPLFKQMLEAMHYLHTHGVAHRDLKPENILLKSPEDPQVKISDFGLSRVMAEGAAMGTLCGTPQYIAPEILLKAQQEGYDKSVDMWSLGVILFVMLSGQLPFDDGKKEMSIYDQIKLGLYSFADESGWKDVSESAKDLCRRLMQVDPAVRWTAQSALTHPWVKNEKMVATPMPCMATPPQGVNLELLKKERKSQGRRATYSVMVQSAIASMGQKDGARTEEIAAFIKSNFTVPENFETPLKKTLAKLVSTNKLTPAKGKKGFKLKR